jgi:hypothetical protein
LAASGVSPRGGLLPAGTFNGGHVPINTEQSLAHSLHTLSLCHPLCEKRCLYLTTEKISVLVFTPSDYSSLVL